MIGSAFGLGQCAFLFWICCTQTVLYGVPFQMLWIILTLYKPSLMARKSSLTVSYWRRVSY